MAVIEVEGLRKVYSSGLFRGRKVEALRGATFEVAEGEVFGILGPNGAGKTTIMKILTGLISPSAGSARILGRLAGTMAVRQRIGYLPEHHRFPSYLTGAKVLDYYGKLSGMSGAEIAAREGEVLELVGMSEWRDTRMREYSKGMAQRMGLAQALIHDPDIIFLDEPTDGVDPVGRAEIRGALKRLAEQGKTIFVNSHLLQEVELVCDRVAILTRGEVLKTGTVKEITARTPQVILRTSASLAPLRAKLEEVFKGEELGPERVWGEGDGQAVELTLPAEDQSKIDATVDAVRGGGLSLLGLIPVRVSLEDAFLEAVGGRQVGAAQAGAPTVVKAKAVKAKVITPGESGGEG